MEAFDANDHGEQRKEIDREFTDLSDFFGV